MSEYILPAAEKVRAEKIAAELDILARGLKQDYANKGVHPMCIFAYVEKRLRNLALESGKIYNTLSKEIPL